MTDLSTFRVTFHVIHPVIAASEIVKVFNLPARYCHSVGVQKITKQGVPLEGVYARTHVGFKLHESPLDFSKYSLTDFIVGLVKSFDKEYLDKICCSGGQCHFSVGVFSSGNVMFDFRAGVIQQLAKANIGLKFDFYGGED